MNRDFTNNLRKQYGIFGLEREDLSDNPMEMFKKWFQEALDADIPEPNTMALATVDKDGHPANRIVLVKEIRDDGLVFFTNYKSRKGQDMAQNPNVSVLFFWQPLERQVRIEGKVERLSEEESKEYFVTRPKGSQIGAWASPQSRVIIDRSELEDRVSELEKIYENRDTLPLPAHWGGYLVKAEYFEFWQGRSSRLHDRFEYRKENDGWEINRLAP